MNQAVLGQAVVEPEERKNVFPLIVRQDQGFDQKPLIRGQGHDGDSITTCFFPTIATANLI